MISFDNTQIAFAGKSNGELRKAYLLFKLIGSNALVSLGKKSSHLALKLRLPIRGVVKATIFSQFCGGEDIVECRKTMANLAQFSIGSILDYSVEGKQSPEELDQVTEEILATLKEANQNDHIPFSVFKVSGVCPVSILQKVSAGEALEPDEQVRWKRVRNRVERICRLAAETGTPVFIDAEESWLQDAIDSLAEEMMQRFNTSRAIVYNTVQLYRHDRLAYLQELHQKAMKGNHHIGVKLVRGAYMEKERKRAAELAYASPIQPDKAATDRDFDAALRYCVEHIDRIACCAGTHNEASSQLLASLLDAHSIPHGDKRLYFAQLLGMSDHISYNLAHAGYNVAKYVPYGPVREVLPYLIRRTEENTSVSGQMSRELSLIVKERNRRKGLK